MTDDRPSIAELQRDGSRVAAQEPGWTYSRDRIESAAPLLLEIAAAALAYRDASGYPGSPNVVAASQRFQAALARVRS